MRNQQSWQNRKEADRARRKLGKRVIMLGDISRELHNQHYDLVNREGMTSEEAAKQLGISYEVVMI